MKTNRQYISFCFLILFACLKGFAQPGLPEFQGKISVMGQLFGAEGLGITTNYFVSNRFAITTGVGIDANVHAGINYYLSDRNRSITTFYTGLQFITVNEYEWDWFHWEKTGVLEGIYLPVGMEIISPKGFTLQLEAGPSILDGSGTQTNSGLFLLVLRLGKTFFPEVRKTKDK